MLDILKPLFNPNNPQKSRLETIRRLINYLHEIFKPAIKTRYLEFDPSFGLNDEFPTKTQFNRLHEIDTRFKALIKDEDLREFIRDLKNDNKLRMQTKRAIYLQILSVNRPFNTASAKWAYIDFERQIWTIPIKEMKTGLVAHEIPLTRLMIKILKEQYLFSGDLSEFVFPSGNKLGHLHRDSIGKAIRNLGEKNKYSGQATSHGFRATFKTICSQNDAQLLKLGISQKVVESALAHNDFSTVIGSYERSKATLEQKRTLLQWYEDYLNFIEDLGL